MPLFEENQRVSWGQKNIFKGIMGVLVAANLVVLLATDSIDGSRAWVVLLWVTLPAFVTTAFWVLAMRLRIRVDESGLRVQAWPLPPTTKISREQIRSSQQCTVRPFREFGGWGVRTKKGHLFYGLGGTNGVTVVYFHKDKDRKLTITTERGDELVAALSL